MSITKYLDNSTNQQVLHYSIFFFMSICPVFQNDFYSVEQQRR